MHRTRNDIPEGKRAEIVRLLNERLVDALDLHNQAKTAHWNVRGPYFFELHQLFDKVADEAREHADLIAERAAALGGVAEGTVQVVGTKTHLPTYPLNISAGLEHTNALANSLAAFARLARAAIDRSNELGDADSADLFTEVSREVDKNLWMVEAHTQAER